MKTWYRFVEWFVDWISEWIDWIDRYPERFAALLIGLVALLSLCLLLGCAA